MRGGVVLSIMATMLLGCSQRAVVWRGTATIGDSAIVFESSHRLHDRGQLRFVCIAPSAADLAVNAQPIQLDVFLVANDGTQHRIGWAADSTYEVGSPTYIVTPTGGRWQTDSGWAVDPPHSPRMRRYGRFWCAEDARGAHLCSAYRAVGISAARPISITEIRWITINPIL